MGKKHQKKMDKEWDNPPPPPTPLTNNHNQREFEQTILFGGGIIILALTCPIWLPVILPMWIVGKLANKLIEGRCNND